MELKEKREIQNELIHSVGSYNMTIDAIVGLCRLSWQLVLESNQDSILKDASSKKRKNSWDYRIIKKEWIDNALDNKTEAEIRTVFLLIKSLQNNRVIWLKKENYCLHHSIFSPLIMARELIGTINSEGTLRYFVLKSIRKYYNCILSSKLYHAFHFLSKYMTNNFLRKHETPEYKHSFQAPDCKSFDNSIVNECKKAIFDDLNKNGILHDDNSNNVTDCFFELLRVAGFIGLSNNANKIAYKTEEIDVAYLFSIMFGIPTGITGLDVLFGGYGPILLDNAVQSNTNHVQDISSQGGRVIAVVGEYGTGKSILSHQIAVAVAKLGGIGWILPFEQSPEECLYQLESSGSFLSRSPFIATDAETTGIAFEYKTDEKGVLRIYQPSELTSENFTFYNCLEYISQKAEKLDKNVLKLLVIDPLNSFGEGENSGTSRQEKIRFTTLKMIGNIKKAGCNLIIVIENPTINNQFEYSSTFSQNLLIIQNIADTVIHLSVRKIFNYAQRFFEIVKSRWQKEQRGEHAFSIIPGEGIHIYPSTSSVLARFKARKPLKIKHPVEFGFLNLEKMFNTKLLYPGDVTLFKGYRGSYKTALGLFFLLVKPQQNSEREFKRKSKAILFTIKDNKESIQHLISNLNIKKHLSKLNIDINHVKICILPKGNVYPGYILQIIETEIVNTRHEGYIIDRIMINNIEEWDISSPMIMADNTFGITLISLLRGLRVTPLLSYSREQNSIDSPLIAAISDNCDCLFQFEKFEYKGMRHINVRIIKSRDMKHSLESYELKFSNKKIIITPNSSLIRLKKGEASPIKICLFFHIETANQLRYYESLQNAIKSIISEETNISFQDHLYLNQAIKIGHFSTIDELQILQLDEYQLAMHFSLDEAKTIPLYEFKAKDWDNKLWNDINFYLISDDVIKSKNYIPLQMEREQFQKDILNKIQNNEDKIYLQSFYDLNEIQNKYYLNKKLNYIHKVKMSDILNSIGYKRKISAFYAIPYYHNISLMAYRKDCPALMKNNEILTNWIQIAHLAKNWEMGTGECSKCDRKDKCRNGGKNKKNLFFDFSKVTPENYNCLFFEILGYFSAKFKPSKNCCILREWLLSECAVNAAFILRQLCHKSYIDNWKKDFVTKTPKKEELQIPLHVTPNAVIYRHWYTTLNQMIDDMNNSESKDMINVTTLPGKITTMGEWYLGIPAYSTAPEVGLEIIKIMTSRDAEINRLRLGIGLPIRTPFYEQKELSDNFIRSSNFSVTKIHLNDLWNRALRRSTIGCYYKVSNIIASNLIKIINLSEIHEGFIQKSDKKIKSIIKNIFKLIVKQIDYVQKNEINCNGNESLLNNNLCKKCMNDFSKQLERLKSATI